MRRFVLSVLAGALLAVPLGTAVGSALADDPEGDGTVAAADCPGAADAYEEAGYPRPDTFTPGCPDLSKLEPYTPAIPVEELAQDCKLYESEPAWCPTREEVRQAGGGS